MSTKDPTGQTLPSSPLNDKEKKKEEDRLLRHMKGKMKTDPEDIVSTPTPLSGSKDKDKDKEEKEKKEREKKEKLWMSYRGNKKSPAESEDLSDVGEAEKKKKLLQKEMDSLKREIENWKQKYLTEIEVLTQTKKRIEELQKNKSDKKEAAPPVVPARDDVPASKKTEESPKIKTDTSDKDEAPPVIPVRDDVSHLKQSAEPEKEKKKKKEKR